MSIDQPRVGYVDDHDLDLDHILEIVTAERDIEAPTRLPVVVGDIVFERWPE